MEHIARIIKQTPINTSGANTGDSSSVDIVSPACPICHGAGVVHPRLPSGKPDYSRVVNCSCIQEKLAQEQQDRLQRYSNLGSLTRFTFDNLQPEGTSNSPLNGELFGRACDAAKAYAKEPKGWLIFTGPSGCGKTHLAAAIANQRISQGYPAFFINTIDLLDHLRSAFNPASEMDYDQLFDQVRNAPLLVLDDLGGQTSTLWAKEKLDQLLNYRYSSQLPTVIVLISPVEQLDERIRTRLNNAQISQVYLLRSTNLSSLEYGWAAEFELQKNMTFESFDRKRANLPQEYRDNLQEAYRVAMDFAVSPDGWLVLMGVYGCGKTHLAAAIANYRYNQHKPALFQVVPEFLDHLRSTFSPESKVSYDQLFESVKATELLILDDFGEQSTTPWAQEKLYQVINYRYNARLATVVTTSCSLEEIESRISSRLGDPKISTPFNIMAPDYRGDVRQSPKKQIPRNKSRWQDR